MQPSKEGDADSCACADIAPFHVNEAYLYQHSGFDLVLKSVLTEQGLTVILLATQGPMCTPSLWKRNQLLVVHSSTQLQSLDSFEPFFLGVALFTNSVNINKI